ncbi:substrate-binding domain-containing protein [Nocardioides cavernae]|uniref:Substrate-binding domain-containing protein n=1 Tax=Nocardioides cavernae TaxID=1921566 RepID=A0ABR8NBG5_9ACTN|nr:substrate-binding domain-containing protein [Nocardioides cavernae]MBD3924209.1 substrate-binding domain-containing protein [Nocardioides cavernae]MBM7510853.1 ribose transport system substrate-binding protein [Nocardioides cavernae]
MAPRSLKTVRTAGLFATALVLAACGSSSNGSGGGGGGSSQADNPANVADEVVGSQDQLVDVTSLCPDSPVTLGYADSNGGNSWRKIVKAEFEDEVAKCGDSIDVIYTDAQGDPEKLKSDLNGMIAKGVDGIALYNDPGPVTLPTVKQAMQRGIPVVLFGGELGGNPGVDYTADVTGYQSAPYVAGQDWATWMAEQLGGKGNVAFLGGPPGNGFSEKVADGILDVFKDHPEMTLLEGGSIDTGWDPAETQKVTAGLLSKYDEVDGIISDYGLGSIGAMRAFQAAGRPLVPWAVQDGNDVACTWKDLSKDNPDFALMTESSRTWISRLASHRLLAAVNRTELDEPTAMGYTVVEDSTKGGDLEPKCNPDLPPDAILSTTLSPDQLAALFS